jgi:hypothetical protein
MGSRLRGNDIEELAAPTVRLFRFTFQTATPSRPGTSRRPGLPFRFSVSRREMERRRAPAGRRVAKPVPSGRGGYPPPWRLARHADAPCEGALSPLRSGLDGALRRSTHGIALRQYRPCHPNRRVMTGAGRTTGLLNQNMSRDEDQEQKGNEFEDDRPLIWQPFRRRG